MKGAATALCHPAPVLWKGQGASTHLRERWALPLPFLNFLCDVRVCVRVCERAYVHLREGGLLRILEFREI